MLLGVSRQSVSKWEAERAYPEMDKLLKMCELFGCTLDELVSSDLTSRPADTAQSVPSTQPMDVTGYDEAMIRFANRLPTGIAVIMLGLALAAWFEGTTILSGSDPDALSAATFLICVGIGLAFIIPSSIERGAFQKAHPFVEDFYTTEQKTAARKTLSTGLVVGIALLLTAIAIAAFLEGSSLLSNSESLSGFIFFLFAAAGVWTIVHSALLCSRVDLKTYNHESLANMDDDEIAALYDSAARERARNAKKENGIYGAIMCTATALGLLLLFVPAFHAQAWFWVVWPVGGVLCGAIAAFKGTR